MVFTVFQYLPSIEEETQTELTSKSSQDDTDGDENSETDTEITKALHSDFNIHLSRIRSDKSMFAIVKNHYSLFFKKINIPPPKRLFV